MRITACPRDMRRPASIAASLPKFLLSTAYLTRRSATPSPPMMSRVRSVLPSST